MMKSFETMSGEKEKRKKKISENVELQHWLESFVFDRVIPATKAENKSDDYRG